MNNTIYNKKLLKKKVLLIDSNFYNNISVDKNMNFFKDYLNFKSNNINKDNYFNVNEWINEFSKLASRF